MTVGRTFSCGVMQHCRLFSPVCVLDSIFPVACSVYVGFQQPGRNLDPLWLDKPMVTFIREAAVPKER